MLLILLSIDHRQNAMPENPFQSPESSSISESDSTPLAIQVRQWRMFVFIGILLPSLLSIAAFGYLEKSTESNVDSSSSSLLAALGFLTILFLINVVSGLIWTLLLPTNFFYRLMYFIGYLPMLAMAIIIVSGVVAMFIRLRQMF